MERDGGTCVGVGDWLAKEKRDEVEQRGMFRRNYVRVKYGNRGKPAV